MTKYARPVAAGDKVRMSDVFDPSIYNPRPSWGETDGGLMDGIFKNEKPSWVSRGQWFVVVPDAVQNGAEHSGDDYADPLSYLNPDGSNGNGEFPPDGG